jgi:hypothetical protein
MESKFDDCKTKYNTPFTRTIVSIQTKGWISGRHDPPILHAQFWSQRPLHTFDLETPWEILRSSLLWHIWAMRCEWLRGVPSRQVRLPSKTRFNINASKKNGCCCSRRSRPSGASATSSAPTPLLQFGTTIRPPPCYRGTLFFPCPPLGQCLGLDTPSHEFLSSASSTPHPLYAVPRNNDTSVYGLRFCWNIRPQP